MSQDMDATEGEQTMRVRQEETDACDKQLKETGIPCAACVAYLKAVNENNGCNGQGETIW